MTQKPDLLYGTAFALISAGISRLALIGGWCLILFWPALSFALVSLSYLIGTTALFGKRVTGTRHGPAMLLLGPYLAFARAVLALQIFISREPAWNAIGDRLICDLTSELTDPPELRAHAGYRCVPMLDANGMSAQRLAELATSLRPEGNRKLLIHCANGRGRTGLVAAAWLLAHHLADSTDDALTMLQNARPGIRLRARQQRSLEEAARILQPFDP